MPQRRPVQLVFLAEEFFVRKIHEWLKVLRKRNVAVVFAIQSLADIRDSAIAPVQIENCPMRLFLPNPRAMEPNVRATYESFGLRSAAPHPRRRRATPAVAPVADPFFRALRR